MKRKLFHNFYLTFSEYIKTLRFLNYCNLHKQCASYYRYVINIQTVIVACFNTNPTCLMDNTIYL